MVGAGILAVALVLLPKSPWLEVVELNEKALWMRNLWMRNLWMRKPYG